MFNASHPIHFSFQLGLFSVKLDPPGGALHNWHSAVVAKNGAIYAVPFSASFALKIEFTGNSVQAGDSKPKTTSNLTLWAV